MVSPVPPTSPGPGSTCWCSSSTTSAGGPCAEYEYFPGYRASITNSPGSFEPKIVADLELERFGLTFTRPNPSLMFPFPDGRAFVAVAANRSGWRNR